MTHSSLFRLSLNDALNFTSIPFKVKARLVLNEILKFISFKVKARRGLNGILKFIPFRVKSMLAFSLNDALKFIIVKFKWHT